MNKTAAAAVTLALFALVLVAFTQSAHAAHVVDEGGYYNVIAYGQWVFEHDVHGGHHCCSGTVEVEAVDLVATLTVGTPLSEDTQYDWVDEGQGYHVTYHGWSEDGWVHWQMDCYAHGCTDWYIVSLGPYPYNG